MAQYDTEALVTPNRHRSAWMWVAIAAMAVVSLARVEPAGSNTIYTNPVLAFLAGQQNGSLTSSGVSHVVKAGSAPRSSMFLHSPGPDTVAAMLPVLFVGLVSPLSLISPRSILSLGRTPSFPGLRERFQRPPPALL